MKPIVRDLYKRFLIAGRDYPQGLNFVREKARTAFMENKDISGEVEIKKAVVKGRYWVRELHAVSKLHKYREMRKRYVPQD